MVLKLFPYISDCDFAYMYSPTRTLWLYVSWWRHEMDTFSALQAICAGYSPVLGEFHAQRPVAPSFDVFFDLHSNKQLSK